MKQENTISKGLRILALFAAGYSFNRFRAEHHGDHYAATWQSVTE